ncbi:hypothetical protein EYR36_003863 [Pleurotus pulmonarius]|nr:hypothetical protein EYR36_003863 [Pleurotus pulmonarius]
MDSGILTIDNLLVLTTAVAFCVSLTPPNAPVPQEQMLQKTFFERTIVLRVFLHKVLLCALSFLHIAASVSGHTNGGGGSSSRYDAAMILGTLICLLSALLRLWCFATLGRFFDFQATVKADHQLITSGPYAYARHPSYAGLAGSYLGTILVLFSAGHWFREYALLGLAGKVVGGIWCAESVVIFVGVPRRANMEDAALKERFGKEWEEFAKRVPFKVERSVTDAVTVVTLILASHSQMLRSLQRQIGARTHIHERQIWFHRPRNCARLQCYSSNGTPSPATGQSGQQSTEGQSSDSKSIFESKNVWDHVFKDINEMPPLLPSAVRNLRSTTNKSEHGRHPRRQTMTAREINAFDDMFNMIFNAVSEQKLSSKAPNAEGPGIGRDAASVGDLFGKLRRHSRRMKWTSEFDELLDRKKEAMNLCDNDQQLLEWGMTEVFGESQKYEAAWRESPDLPMQPPTYPHLLALLIKEFRDKYGDPNLALAIFNYAKNLSIASYVFGCSTQAYNELIETRWSSFQDLKGVHDALEEMIVNGVELDSRTRKLVDTVRRDIGGQQAGWREVNDVFGKEMWNLMTKIDGLVKAGTPESPDGRLRLDEWKTIGDDDDRGWDFDSWSGSTRQSDEPRERSRNFPSSRFS